MTRWLGIALLPTAEHRTAAIRLQREVGGGHELRPPLSPDGNLPHVTVFQGPFLDSFDPATELDRIVAGADAPERIALASRGVVYQPTGWVFLALERPPLLEKIQQSTLAVLAPHLDRPAFDPSKDVSRFTEDERESFERYGYRYTGPAYAPHITLGRAEEAVAQELVRSAPERVDVPGIWVFDRFSCYVMGENGAHAEIVEERALRPR
ncbi:hypothetical protein IHE55_30025 [Streptomyces pactum]|uniref:2'-5' RNA ligase family protein n=1 Tax=Streptomyces pactum TaxID=68249 RepID=A0ABS0NU95_9ACTN|nr:hypothetical protein [Streptomyces pactum]MBH5338789.1 hypothetical protein [Streptomyces pactum]